MVIPTSLCIFLDAYLENSFPASGIESLRLKVKGMAIGRLRSEVGGKAKDDRRGTRDDGDQRSEVGSRKKRKSRSIEEKRAERFEVKGERIKVTKLGSWQAI